MRLLYIVVVLQYVIKVQVKAAIIEGPPQGPGKGSIAAGRANSPTRKQPRPRPEAGRKERVEDGQRTTGPGALLAID